MPHGEPEGDPQFSAVVDGNWEALETRIRGGSSGGGPRQAQDAIRYRWCMVDTHLTMKGHTKAFIRDISAISCSMTALDLLYKYLQVQSLLTTLLYHYIRVGVGAREG